MGEYASVPLETAHILQRSFPKSTPTTVLDSFTEIQEDPFSLFTWKHLLLSLHTFPQELAIDILERFLSVFPTTPRYWLKLISIDLISQHFDSADTRFNEALALCKDVDLYRLYVRYVSRDQSRAFSPDDANIDTFPDLTFLSEEQFKEASLAFEYSLNEVGEDPSSLVLYKEYISLLNSRNYTTAFDENKKISTIRFVYHRALTTPLKGSDALWEDYVSFENIHSPQTHSSHIAEVQPKYLEARAVLKEVESRRLSLDMSRLSVPAESRSSGDQFLAWSKLIEFELTNPLTDEDRVKKRTILSFDQMTICLGRLTEVWHRYAHYLFSIGKTEDAKHVYERGSKFLGHHPLFVFSRIDFYELVNDLPLASNVFESFLESYPSPEGFVQYILFKRRTAGKDGGRKAFVRSLKDSSYVNHHVYLAVAQLESSLNNDDTAAQKIFERGLKFFSDKSSFVLAYSDFLIRIKDERNCRLLFERVLSRHPSREVYSAYVNFELMFGNLDRVWQLEKKQTSSFSLAPLYPLACRTKQGYFWPTDAPEVFLLQDSSQELSQEKRDFSKYYTTNETGEQTCFLEANSEYPQPNIDKLTSDVNSIEQPVLTVTMMKILKLFPDVDFKSNPDEILDLLVSANVPGMEQSLTQQESEEVFHDAGVKRRNTKPKHDIFGDRMRRQKRTRK
ncbi:hypothetical protein P9112_002558 [Eukaryota sp. TZLM1-RC]